MARIRPHALKLVDSWMIPDYLLDRLDTLSQKYCLIYDSMLWKNGSLTEMLMVITLQCPRPLRRPCIRGLISPSPPAKSSEPNYLQSQLLGKRNRQGD